MPPGNAILYSRQLGHAYKWKNRNGLFLHNVDRIVRALKGTYAPPYLDVFVRYLCHPLVLQTLNSASLTCRLGFHGVPGIGSKDLGCEAPKSRSR